jgi:exodeoxyribonuclease V beta subunit
VTTTLVEASAGTGKTWRITQVVAEQVVDHGVPIDHILVVTFTEAATAELRARVRRRLSECAAGARAARSGSRPATTDDPDLDALLARHARELDTVEHRLRAALEQFDLATICTIHGFCQRMLSRFALEAAAPFDVSPTGDGSAVATEVALDWWTAETSALAPAVVGALDRRFVGWKDEGRPGELVALAVKLADDPELQLVPPPAPGLLATAGPADAPMAALRSFSAVARAEVAARLARARSWTYTDLLVRLRDAVTHPDTAPALLREVRAAYRVALIDEFQDTDPVQWAIFRTLFHGHGALWLIGDPKQAIYAFRGADVHTYLDAAAVPGLAREERLDQNHRSDPGLVHAVNHLFGRLRAPYVVAGITHQAVAAHHARRLLDDEPPLSIRFVPRASHPLSLRTAQDREDAAWTFARLCARDVARWLQSGARLVGEDGRERSPAPRDVAVLTRTNLEARMLRDALRRVGVPVVTRTDDDVFDTPVARELLTVLRAILEPSDGALRGRALLTRLLGRTVADLADLATDDEALSAEVARFRRWHAAWAEQGFAAAFQALLTDAGVVERLLCAADGPRVVADLLHLGELLHGSASEGRGPAALVQWLGEGGPGAGDASQVRLEADDDAVTVVTMHKAKGLEWPLVWCPSLFANAFVGKADEALLRVRLPDGSRVLDLRTSKDPEKRARLAEAKREAFAEVVRLAYVALTRARHRTVVYGGPLDEAGGSALAWLLHQHPTASEPELPGATAHRLSELTEAEILAEVRAVAAGSGGTIGVSLVDPLVNGPGAYRPADAAALAARPLRRKIPLDTSWRRSSFSRLAADAWTAHAGRAEDRDADPDEEGAARGADRRPIPLAEVPSFGTALGDATHGALEDVDFTDPGDLPARVEARCREHGVPVEHAPAVAEALRGVLLTPLLAEDPTFTLSTVPRSDRRSELDFHLPVAGGFSKPATPLVARALSDALAAWPDPAVPAGYAEALRALAWAPLRGFLAGSIDLVVRRGGQVWVADYKSNRAGPVFGSYTPEALSESMASHHYVLQALLYAVAVHRWMRVRDPAYRYETHFGGVLYLFLRGMTPDTGSARGIWRWRPAPGLIGAVDRALRGHP